MSQPTTTTPAGRGSRVLTIAVSATILALSGVFAFASERTPTPADTAEVPSVTSTFSADLTNEATFGGFGAGTSASSSSGSGGSIQSPSTGN